MATIGGLSGSASNSVNMYGASVKGYGGLASGLDTDSLIEGMTIGTRTKIQEALKQKQSYQWEMDAYRSVSDQLVAFSGKYLNVTSASSPYRTSFFDRSVVTPHGAFSKYLSVSGASSAIDNMSVLGIKQLAKDSSLVTNQEGSIKSLNTAGVDFGEIIETSKLEGGQLTFKIGSDSYSLTMNSGEEIYDASAPDGRGKTDFTTAAKTEQSINAMLKNIKLKDGTGTLADKINLSVSSPSGNFVLKQKDSSSTETISLAGGTASALEAMGFLNSSGVMVNGGIIPPQSDPNGLVGETDVVNDDVSDPASPKKPLMTTQTFAEFMAGKTITFNYNGSSKRITLPKKDIIEGWGSAADKDSGMQAMATYMNDELGKVFGTGKISVQANPGNASGLPSLSFTTPDASSILRITDADTGIMGVKGVLGISYSTTNRLSAEVSLAKSGLKGLPPGFGDYTLDADGKKTYTVTPYNDAEGNLLLSLNGISIPADKIDKDGNPIVVPKLTVESSLSQIMMAVNDSEAGVKMSYNETADRFSMASTNHGEAGKIDVGAESNNFLGFLTGAASGGNTYIQGQDAILTVKYEGNIETDIKRDSNTFKLDGTTFTLNNTFGFTAGLVDSAGAPASGVFGADGKPITEQVKVGSDGNAVPPIFTKDADGNLTSIPASGAPGDILYNYHTPVADTESITFTSAVDTEKVTKIIGSMVEDYNTMADLINKLVGTKPDKNYGPLTDDEKAQINADQIKQLEDKAKEGILFNDTLLRSLSDKMRSVFSGVADAGTLKSMGLNLSNSWKDNGKISFNEEDFKNALLENSEKVKKLFTEPPTINSDGETERVGGVTVRLKDITDQFAGISGFRKGSLIEKAGSIAVPTSVLQNSLKTLMDDIDDQVDRLKDKLKVEVDRYTKQFSSLEQLISQMNSQSSWFSQATG